MTAEELHEWVDWANSPSTHRLGRNNILPEITQFIQREALRALNSTYKNFYFWWKNPDSEEFGENNDCSPKVWASVSETLTDQLLENTFGIKYSSLKEIPSEKIISLLTSHLIWDRTAIDFAAFISVNKMAIKSEENETILLGCDRDCSDTVQIPEGVTIIGRSAFYDSEQLQKVIIPSSVKEIDDEAFYDCKNLKMVIVNFDMTDPSKGLRKIGNRAFYGCTSLCNLTIPQSVDTIEDGAFAECEHLHKVVILNDKPNIQDGAFAGCQLTKVPNWIKKVNEIKSCLFENNSISTAIVS